MGIVSNFEDVFFQDLFQVDTKLQICIHLKVDGLRLILSSVQLCPWQP